MSTSRQRVSVVYHFFPHYRAPVLRALQRSKIYQFEFWGATEGVAGILPFLGDSEVSIKPLTFKRGIFGENIGGGWKAILDRNIAAVIILGNPNILATWFMAITARLLGKKVLFWAHGWLRPEPRVKAVLRNVYFSLANRVLTYDDRARVVAGRSGFAAEKISPIYNSLDWPLASRLFAELKTNDLRALRASIFRNPELPILICTARLTRLCRFDLLIEAISALKKQGLETVLVLVGDGPERRNLEEHAERLMINTQFLGAVYDERRLAELIYAADVTVSPGKVGLTAMHSLMYGTPVITHDDRDAQMPEVEAIRRGVTGDFFQKDNAADLAKVISDWLVSARNREVVREECQKIILQRYNPDVQRSLIEEALSKVLGK